MGPLEAIIPRESVSHPPHQEYAEWSDLGPNIPSTPETSLLFPHFISMLWMLYIGTLNVIKRA
jgi:hypothetical protein